MVLTLIKKFVAKKSNFSGKRWNQVRTIGSLEAKFSSMTDEELKKTTWQLQDRARAIDGFDRSLINDSFALVREAAKRVLNQRPYDVQIYGGLVLHEGKIAEMRTGEGKTLVAALPTYLNALKGRGVHVITVNDYLAKRDAEMIGKIHQFLGLTVGVIQQDMPDNERRQAYSCDITYGTNSQIGFDYLRDNLRFDNSQLVQRGHEYAIIDEVDSVLIDEARTPLIISGSLDDQSDTYLAYDAVVSALSPGEDYKLDGKSRSVSLTERGLDRVEHLLREAGLLAKETALYTAENTHVVHHLNAALKAHGLFKKDKEYLVKNGEVVLVDEGTGRIMNGRRFSDSIHQALEAKEKVAIQSESQTLTSITYQNLFRLYKKLSGMTGTASTEVEEFSHIYGLDVIQIPTHLPVQRVDAADEIHLTENAKLNAIVKAIQEAHSRGQPVLVGTPSVEKSEAIARRMLQAGFSLEEGHGKPVFRILNARNHELEADIVSDAGKIGAITIATNMAGRGTDIKLGGNEEVEVARYLQSANPEQDHAEAIKAIHATIATAREQVRGAGGLFVIGSERHDSRRVDNQLRGRSGRQGDPGKSQFYVCLNDEVVKTFGSEQIHTLASTLGLREGDAISHPLITKMLDRAQQKVESAHYEIRKDVVKFDDVLNQQRLAMHQFRQEIMAQENCAELIDDMRHLKIEETILEHIPPHSYPAQWKIRELEQALLSLTSIGFGLERLANEEGTTEDIIIEKVTAISDQVTEQLRNECGPENYELARKHFLLSSLDKAWREHLQNLEELKSVINFRSYGQREPIQEFRAEAYEMFKSMMDQLRNDVVVATCHIRPRPPVVMLNPDPKPEAA